MKFNTQINLIVFGSVILIAAMTIALLKGLAPEPKEVHFSGEQIHALVKECYENNLVPVFTRNERGEVTKLTCKEKN